MFRLKCFNIELYWHTEKKVVYSASIMEDITKKIFPQ